MLSAVAACTNAGRRWWRIFSESATWLLGPCLHSPSHGRNDMVQCKSKFHQVIYYYRANNLAAIESLPSNTATTFISMKGHPRSVNLPFWPPNRHEAWLFKQHKSEGQTIMRQCFRDCSPRCDRSSKAIAAIGWPCHYCCQLWYAFISYSDPVDLWYLQVYQNQ